MIGQALEGRHLVLTGVTGFLGKVWLVMLLDRFPNVGKVTVFVRGGRAGALARFERIADTSPAFRPLKARHGSGLGSFLAERVTVLDADIQKPDCGLSKQDLAHLRDADLFLHCAGITDFDPDPKKALGTNTFGAVRIAELAERAGAPLVHVSTCYVAGVADGDVPEAIQVGRAPNGALFDPLATIEQSVSAVHKPRLADRVAAGTALANGLGWPNIYTWSKGLAEHALASRPNLKLTIARPSIVECANSFPFPGWNEGLNTAGPLAWLISTAFRRLPATPTHRFDIIPVDEVAKGLLLTCAAALKGRAPKVVQLASSDTHPLTFARTIELTGLALRRYTRKGGGTSLERTWFRHLDPVPGDGGWILPFEDRSWIEPLQEQLEALEKRDLGERWVSKVASWRRKLVLLADDRDKVETMLAIYRPFIQQYDWCFSTAALRALNTDLPSHEADLAFEPARICWRTYWVDVEYPGLMMWSVPILRNQPIPVDLPSNPPLRLQTSARVASK